MPPLDAVSEWLHYCGRCNSCKYLYRNYLPSCPAFEFFQWESYTSSGKVWMALDLHLGRYPLSESVRDRIYACTLCGNCAEQCQQEISNHSLDIFQALRELCVEEGCGPMPAHVGFKKNVEEHHNPYGGEHDARFEGIPEKYFKPTAEVLYFVGCTAAYRDRTLLLDTLEVLEKLGVDFTLSRDEWCCGSPLLTTGQKGAARHLAEHNAELFQRLGAKTVVTACAGCYRTLRLQYPLQYQLLQPTSTKKKGERQVPEVLHVSQFLARVLKKSHLKPQPGHAAHVVTYHDPCHIGRHAGIYEEPRKVLHLLEKSGAVAFTEMPRNRANAWCCGAGGGVRSAFPDFSLATAEQRVTEALDTVSGVDFIVSTCPFCERNLVDASNRIHQAGEGGGEGDAHEIRVIDLVTLLKGELA